MTVTMLEVACRDPIVSRDGRPFGTNQGNGMRTAGWPLPSVVAGSLRTALGKAAGREFSDVTAKELLRVEVAGMFPLADGKLYLPAPNDCFVPADKRLLAARPIQDDGGGCDWPRGGLRPVMLSAEDAPDEFKPREKPAWWPSDAYVAWLTGRSAKFDRTFLQAPLTEHRTHVWLKAETGAAAEGMLSTSAALALSHLPRWDARPTDSFDGRFAQIRLALRVTADQWASDVATRLDVLHPLGGERRLAHWKTVASAPWGCPQAVSAALEQSGRVRMALATPAIFAQGWKPGWLNDQLTGSPWKGGPTLKLVGACIQRWRAVSGWSLAALPDQPRGPKPVKRMVPAGGVYFLEVVGGNAAGLARGWLQPVSDDEQDRRDGFGLAAWGTW
jgi:CRISPR-associated protein Cmr3